VRYLSFFLAIFFHQLAFCQSSEWAYVQASDKSGDWIAGTYASGVNNFLGMRCFKKLGECGVVISSPVKCEDNAKYPMLVNSDTGSYSIEGTCIINGGKYEQLLSPYDVISKAIYVDDGVIGIAVPLASGEFRAYRFSLYNAKRAIDEVGRRFSTSNGSKPTYTF